MFRLIIGDMSNFQNVQELVDCQDLDPEFIAKYEVYMTVPAEGYTLEETARNFLWGLASDDGWSKDGSLSYFYEVN
jgi:hypothetical protein